MKTTSDLIDSISSKLCDEKKNSTATRPTNYQQLEQQISQIELRRTLEDLIAGSQLGITAYQKPVDGIPFTDLNLELQNLILKGAQFQAGNSFGRVVYDKKSNKLLFYAYDDSEMERVLGEATLTLQELQEADPTVPAYIKRITQEDIKRWNSNSSDGGTSVSYNKGNLIFE